MKTTITKPLTQLKANELLSLTTQVRETIATEYSIPRENKFTNTDLWNIQRRAKSTFIRRYLTLF